ncbi:MAG: hypothetical protein ACJ76H_09465 [Bacteriovoracaceae bacterium]
MKTLLLSLFLTLPAFALDCGTYKITAPAKISSFDHMFFRMQIAMNKEHLDLTWQSQQKFPFMPSSWISGIIFLRKRTSSSNLEGIFEYPPQTLGPASEKGHRESIELIEARPCSEPK